MIDFKLNPRSGVPFYRQIIDQIRFGIASGALKVGDQLPTVRQLAVDLKVNLNTVTKAYKELEIQNVVQTQQGTGTFIGTTEIDLPEKERRDKLRDICREFYSIAATYGFNAEDIISEIQQMPGGQS